MTLRLFSTGSIAALLSKKWQPIWVLAIDHPEGIFLVDTGITTRTRHPWYKFRITRNEEIDRQLAGANLQPQKIILTHRHFDHTGGLYHFPHIPVIHPAPEDYNETCGPFTKARYLTADKNLVLVHTPGHTRDHCSVLIKTDTRHILFAGDVATTQNQLTDPTIKTYAQQYPLIVLLTHDPESKIRLESLEPLPSSKTGNPQHQ